MPRDLSRLPDMMRALTWRLGPDDRIIYQQPTIPLIKLRVHINELMSVNDWQRGRWTMTAMLVTDRMQGTRVRSRRLAHVNTV